MHASSNPASDVHALCEALEACLDGSLRREITDRVTRAGGIADALRRLRASLSSHALEGLSPDIVRTIGRLDQRTRQDGFRVLHSWNHTTHRFTDELVPVLMIDFFERAGAEDPDPRATVSILTDYYLLHLLALAAMRAWDTEDPAALLDRVTGLLDLLQGPDGSGHHFVADAETLLIHALSQFHPEEQAYDRIIEKVASLPRDHQIRFARVSAAVLGAHLRWGFWLMYERDIQRMRDDNVGDYPWLLWSVTTLLRAWAGMADDPADDDGTRADGSPDRPAERRAIAGSLLLGLAADPWVFGGRPPASLEPFAEMYAECRALLEANGERLLEEMEEHRPTKDAYAPLSLLFNFPHNALVAAVTVALMEGRPRSLGLNDLFDEEAFAGAGAATVGSPESRKEFALALMRFSHGNAARVGYQGAPLVAYDPLTALRTYSMTRKALRETLP
jgi:hypothetical protein